MIPLLYLPSNHTVLVCVCRRRRCHRRTLRARSATTAGRSASCGSATAAAPRPPERTATCPRPPLGSGRPSARDAPFRCASNYFPPRANAPMIRVERASDVGRSDRIAACCLPCPRASLFLLRGLRFNCFRPGGCVCVAGRLLLSFT